MATTVDSVSVTTNISITPAASTRSANLVATAFRNISAVTPVTFFVENGQDTDFWADVPTIGGERLVGSSLGFLESTDVSLPMTKVSITEASYTTEILDLGPEYATLTSSFDYYSEQFRSYWEMGRMKIATDADPTVTWQYSYSEPTEVTLNILDESVTVGYFENQGDGPNFQMITGENDVRRISTSNITKNVLGAGAVQYWSS